MAQAGLAFSVIQSEKLPLGRDKIFYRKLLLKYPAMKNSVPIPLESLESSPEASMALNDGKCFLTTSAFRKLERNFDFWCSLLKFEALASEVSFTAKVLRGRADVFLIDDTGKVVSSVEIWPTDKPISRTLYAGENRLVCTLMIRNKMPDTSKSKVEIYEVSQGAD
jgi:hypothetical protein